MGVNISGKVVSGGSGSRELGNNQGEFFIKIAAPVIAAGFEVCFDWFGGGTVVDVGAEVVFVSEKERIRADEIAVFAFDGDQDWAQLAFEIAL